jgi:hypothetical protein
MNDSLLGEAQSELATSNGITNTLRYYYGNSIHIIDPASGSIASPIDANTFRANSGLHNYASFINGFINQDGEHNTDGSILDGKALDRPLVIPVNTASVAVESAVDGSAIGGSHWVCFVVLPKGYTEENPDHEMIFFMDPYGKASNIRESQVAAFVNMLTRGILDIPAPFSDACFIRNPEFAEQSVTNGTDCGWWTVYNIIQTVRTGSNEFLSKYAEADNASAQILRQVLPPIMSHDEPGREEDPTEETPAATETREAFGTSGNTDTPAISTSTDTNPSAGPSC